MKNIITILFVFGFASAVGWYFMPQDWRGKISSAASVALGGNKQEIKKYLNNVVFPQDPEKRRTVLLDELKKSLAEVKKEGADGLASKNSLATAEEIVKNLEEANQDKTLSQKFVDKVLNKIFPTKSEVTQCKK